MTGNVDTHVRACNSKRRLIRQRNLVERERARACCCFIKFSSILCLANASNWLLKVNTQKQRARWQQQHTHKNPGHSDALKFTKAAIGIYAVDYIWKTGHERSKYYYTYSISYQWHSVLHMRASFIHHKWLNIPLILRNREQKKIGSLWIASADAASGNVFIITWQYAYAVFFGASMTGRWEYWPLQGSFIALNLRIITTSKGNFERTKQHSLYFKALVQLQHIRA